MPGRAIRRDARSYDTIVADPAICLGKPTFLGTRILVEDILDQVARGMAWEAIAEAVRLAREAFLAQDLPRAG